MRTARSDWGDAKADLSLHWGHMPLCWFYHEAVHIYQVSGNKLGGDLGEVVFLQEQTYPYFQLREKSKCIEYIGKSKF